MIKINLLSKIVWECRVCKTEKYLNEFVIHNRSPRTNMENVHLFSRESICRSCQSNRNARKARTIKAKVIAGYGGRCMCPGCDVIERAFLSLDHVVACGYMYRKEHGGQDGAWRDALQKNFPPDYQLLCFNCNNAKAFNPVGCPHTGGMSDRLPLEYVSKANGRPRECTSRRTLTMLRRQETIPPCLSEGLVLM